MGKHKYCSRSPAELVTQDWHVTSSGLVPSSSKPYDVALREKILL